MGFVLEHTPAVVMENLLTIMVSLVLTVVMVFLSKLFGADNNEDLEDEVGKDVDDKVSTDESDEFHWWSLSLRAHRFAVYLVTYMKLSAFRKTLLHT